MKTTIPPDWLLSMPQPHTGDGGCESKCGGLVSVCVLESHPREARAGCDMSGLTEAKGRTGRAKSLAELSPESSLLVFGPDESRSVAISISSTGAGRSRTGMVRRVHVQETMMEMDKYHTTREKGKREG